MKTEFICQNCGARSAKWIGNCPSCGAWNTYLEEPVVREKKNAGRPGKRLSDTRKITEINPPAQGRMETGSREFDRIIGGGIQRGSVILLGGEPGIGKSTLALQLILQMKDVNSLYVSGEESMEQIRFRAERIGALHERCLVLNETFLEHILQRMQETAPDIIIVDSIQTLYSETITSTAGSVSQIRECTARLLGYAKENDVPVILIGHITKEGSLAGPKVLEHIVDTVLQFEGERNHFYRILRSVKNRFGPASGIAIFEMTENGLREILNPSEILTSRLDEEVSGIATASSLEGIRPLLVEVQALVSQSGYGTPQRTANGVDLRRLSMLLAVLEKRAGFDFSSRDVFLNIAGGIRISDPGTDLAVISAIISSMTDVAVPGKSCFAGELGLSGEVRPVARIPQRIEEAEKLGFTRMILSGYDKKNVLKKNPDIELLYVTKVQDIFRRIFKAPV